MNFLNWEQAKTLMRLGYVTNEVSEYMNGYPTPNSNFRDIGGLIHVSPGRVAIPDEIGKQLRWNPTQEPR